MLVRGATIQTDNDAPPLIRVANATIKTPITEAPPDIPKVSAPRLFGDKATQTVTLQKLNAAELKKPIDEQVLFVQPSQVTPSGNQNIITPIIVAETPKLSIPVAELSKRVELYTPTNNVPISKVVNDIKTKTEGTTPLDNKIIIYGAIGLIGLALISGITNTKR